MKRLIPFLLAALCAVGIFISGASASTGYVNPNGTHWHCQQYTTPHRALDSWDCISGFGFLYGASWAFVSDFYQHPNPSTDYVVNEAYFNQDAANGMTKTAQWRHRIIAVDDPVQQGLIEPLNWRVSASDQNPPAPVTCLVLTGGNQGKQVPCSPLDQKSILDYWHQANVIPNQVPW